jgi:hypothetical protein
LDFRVNAVVGFPVIGDACTLFPFGTKHTEISITIEDRPDDVSLYISKSSYSLT